MRDFIGFGLPRVHHPGEPASGHPTRRRVLRRLLDRQSTPRQRQSRWEVGQPLVSRLLDQPVDGMTYAGAGVSIEAGDEVVRADQVTGRRARTGPRCWAASAASAGSSPSTPRTTAARPGGLGRRGRARSSNVARQVGRYDTVGIDLVAMLVDDLACVGAEPLFLLDYVAVGNLDPARLEELVAGHREGCRLADDRSARRRDRGARRGDGAR